MRMRRKRVIRGEKDYQTTASNSISLETFYNKHFLAHPTLFFLSPVSLPFVPKTISIMNLGTLSHFEQKLLRWNFKITKISQFENIHVVLMAGKTDLLDFEKWRFFGRLEMFIFAFSRPPKINAPRSSDLFHGETRLTTIINLQYFMLVITRYT